VNAKFVISVRHGRGPLTEVRARAERRPDLLVEGTGAVLYAILDHVVDDYELAAEGIDVDLQEVEKQVFSSTGRNPAERIYKLEREVLDFYRAVAPLTEAVGVMSRGHFELIPEPLHEYYRDVHDHLRRVNGRISAFRDLLSSALQANLTQVSVQQNNDMRRISAWVAILAIPTMIAGIYGMNFDNMPELHWTYGYPVVLVVTVVICGTLYWRFKRAGWL
jgi:magnesium transporter